jgi:Ca2+-binding RTX toxin-like protein/GH24 family phage-related lysozyme (muramidase)
MEPKLSQAGLEKLKSLEGYKLKAYQDDGKVWTIGYGHTGSDVFEGQVITPEEAGRLFASDLAVFERTVSRLVKVDLNQNQFDTLVMFAYNVGSSAFSRSSVLKMVNVGNFDAVPTWLSVYNKVKGVENNGLINRRNNEINWWKMSPISIDPRLLTTSAILVEDNEVALCRDDQDYTYLFRKDFNKWTSDLLLTGAAPPAPYKPEMPSYGPSFTPIGAFYESVSPAADNALSIADKTPVLLDAANNPITATQLAARDANADGQLTGAELNGLSAWADLNQNGLLDAGEIKSLTAGTGAGGVGNAAGINTLDAARGDYTFYTQGNGNPGTGVAATPTINQTAPTLTVPASNYRSLRDTGNHRTIAMGTIEDEVWLINGQRIVTKSHYGETQWIDWSANQIKQSNDNTALIGTDGADTFDASYYSATSGLPSSGLVNFMAGGGDDLMGGSTRSDNLWGGTGNDLLFGYAGDDKLYGEDGDDQLQGGEGADSLAGGLGNDALLGQAGNDILVGNEGNDELQGNEGNDWLTGDSGNDKLFGQVGNDQLWGGDGEDVLVGFTASNEAKQSLATGETDNDTLIGGAGNDYLLGGLGDDQLDGGSGQDEITGDAGHDRIMAGSEDDRVFGGVGDDQIWGGDGNDVLVGFTASNDAQQTLNAGETDHDKIYAGAGNDLILGGWGDDQIYGEDGDDTYMVNSVNDSIVEGRNEGYDTVISSTNYQLNQNIEELRLLEGYNIHGTGNALNNKIMGNSADNILDGITGADTLMGGLGNDTYYVDNAGDQVLENQNEGTDTVQTSISYTLADNLENLNLLDFSKPELGRVTGSDGVAMPALIYGFPKRFELDYLQGDEVDGFQGTCALTSIANLLTLSGKPTTEGEVVRRAIDNQWARIDPSLPAWQRGGSNAYEQQQLLTSYGLRNDMIAGYNETGIANLVRSGRGVIVAVDAGIIWESTLYQTGQVNHAVTLTGVVYKESDGSLLGFYITDSGRAKVSDMTRFIPIDLFRQAANVPGAYALYTIAPVKLWDEDIDGTGNAGDNQIIGNRGDNQLLGLANGIPANDEQWRVRA